MTTVLLIRHGMCDPVGQWLAGRSPGVHLNSVGREQVERLASALESVPLAAVYTSPLERARETAEPLAAACGCEAVDSADLLELDFGEWTGRGIAELDEDPRWRAFNERRGSTRIPGGELMEEVVRRGERMLAEVQRRHAGQTIAAVSHGDVIRGLLARLLGMPLDSMLRLEVSPASVSTVALTGETKRVLAVNWRAGDLLSQLAS